MTDGAIPEPDRPQTEKTGGSGRLRPLRPEAGSLVDQKLGGEQGLQARYLRNESSGRAQLAVLRKAAAKAPGEVPEIWELTQVGVSDYAADTPTWEELATHTAMTLYAIHQQSRTEAMFRPGVGLGSAAWRLIGGADQENPSARARFNALVTSTTFGELRHHLRALVSQLRARSIPLDHAMLADDLVRFQQPGGAKQVRLTWARQYANIPYTHQSDIPTSTNTLSKES